MELICGTASSGKGWRDFFSGAMNARGDGDDMSSHSAQSRSTDVRTLPVPIRAKYLLDTSSDVFSLSLDARTTQRETYDADDPYRSIDFKVTDHSGHLFKIKCAADSLEGLRCTVSSKLSIPAADLLLKYTDEEGDEVVLSSDALLREAVDFARSSGSASLKIRALIDPEAAARTLISSGDSDKGGKGGKGSGLLLKVGAGVAVVGLITGLLFALNKRKS
ncbi:hypothetical protein B484DRAFT_406132 [Ochromonadaceae sp. CCMP2298]|nr:hypothetical protein B484DRAFT_406132 [Ochromonadaceae sp. CCMP2298]